MVVCVCMYLCMYVKPNALLKDKMVMQPILGYMYVLLHGIVYEVNV